MAFRLDILRADDLLNVTVEGANLRVDTTEPEHPVLAIENEQQPAFLTFVFPPQTIAEQAFFEASNLPGASDPARADPENAPTPPGPPNPVELLPDPGDVKARAGGRSRLVFRVPSGTRLEYSVSGLLDWSGLSLNVHPIAAIGPSPTAAEIVAAPPIAAPAPNETAIELPYRLTISPNAAVGWAHRRLPFTARGRTELWHTRLLLKRARAEGHGDEFVELSRDAQAPLRALWSEDYRPQNPPRFLVPDPALTRSAMTPNDRHQLVILTSAFHDYEVDRDFFGGIRLDRVPGIALRPSKLTVPYVPQPFFADQFMLSPLGAWLRSRGNWAPPRRVLRRPRFDFPGLDRVFRVDGFPLPPAVPPGASTGVDTPAPAQLVHLAPEWMLDLFGRPVADVLNLSEWVHIAAQGRDHYVRIVYEGELWPTRHAASLIKVTERKFAAPNPNGPLVAYMFQRMFIVVRQPVRDFRRNDRGMPWKRVQLTTLVTPDIAPPDLEAPSGAFWVEVMTGGTARARFSFHGVGTDIAGDELDFTMPMMFVPRGEPETTAAAGAYNASGSKADLDARSAVVPGQKLTFAAAAAGNDNTRLTVRAVNLVMDANGAACSMLKADVGIPQVQALLGADATTSIRYFPDYVANGFDATTGVFAEVVRETYPPPTSDPHGVLAAHTLDVKFASNQAGGIATPNLAVSTLSRELGPLAGTAANAAIDNFDPKSFFPPGLARLFGTFDLSDLLPGSTTLTSNAPKLRTESKSEPGGKGKRVIATLDWEPTTTTSIGDAKIALLRISAPNALHIRGRVETLLLAGGAPPPPPTSAFEGTLRGFDVEVLGSVIIRFTEFAFTAHSGAKTDVRVKLNPAKPLEFKGDLEFVEELRNAIPSDLFGNGPSLDISPTGIRAGFAFGLPPIAVGVFALKDVTLGAALTLPFLDGKPTFDFNVSERARPFLLAVGIFGGGGFFRLQLDTAGMRLVEAAFEFGVVAVVDLGVASGGMHIMAGIYFKLERKEASSELSVLLSGYLRMGGFMTFLGFVKISVEFCLSFTYDGIKHKAYGRATLTVMVDVTLFSVKVEVTVERAFGGQGGDPKFRELFTTAAPWREYALAFA